MKAGQGTRPAELDRQSALLAAPVGAPGSGMTRYGAAMFFYLRGDLSAEMLEIYRRCCNLDNEDPIDLARFEGVEAKLLPPRDEGA